MIHQITSEMLEEMIKLLLELKDQLAEHTDMNPRLNILITELCVELMKDQND